MKTIFKLAFIILIFFANQAHAKYSIFNPVPKNKMRPIAVDRPSKSDAAQTLDAGHFMIETSFIDYKRNSDSSSKSENFDFLTSSTFKVGLTDNQEFQMIIDSYKYQRTHNYSDNSFDEIDGFGDVTLRVKHNFFGNDSGKYALTLIPFLKIPTNQNNIANDNYEGGISLPLAINFQDFSLTIQNGISYVKDEKDHQTSYSGILTLSKNFTNKISAFSEVFFSKSNLQYAKWQNTVDFGIAYSLSDNLVIDLATNIGISQYADDLNILSGIAYRF